MTKDDTSSSSSSRTEGSERALPRKALHCSFESTKITQASERPFSGQRMTSASPFRHKSDARCACLLIVLLAALLCPETRAFSVSRNGVFPVFRLDSQGGHDHHCPRWPYSPILLLRASNKDTSEKDDNNNNKKDKDDDDETNDDEFFYFTDPDEDTEFEKRISKFTATAIAAERAAEREELRKLRQELGAQLDDDDDEEDDFLDEQEEFYLDEEDMEEEESYEFSSTQSVNPEFYAQPGTEQVQEQQQQMKPPLRRDSFDGAKQVSYFSTPSPDSFHFSPFAAPIPSANNLNSIPMEGQYTPEAAEALLSLALFESRCGRMARSQQAWEQLIYLLQMGGETTGRELVTNLLRFAKWAELEAANVPLARKLYNDLLQLPPHTASQVKQPWVFRQWAAFEERQGEYERSAIIISFIEELMPSPYTSGTVEPARHFGKQTLMDGTPLKDNVNLNNGYSSSNANSANGPTLPRQKTYVTTVSPVDDSAAPSTLPQTTAANLPVSKNTNGSSAPPSMKAGSLKATTSKKKTVPSWTTSAVKPKTKGEVKPWMSPQKKASPWQPKKKATTSASQSTGAKKTTSPFVPSGDSGWKPAPSKPKAMKKFNPGTQTAGWKSIAAGSGGAASAAAKRIASNKTNSQQLSDSKHAIDEAISRLDEAIASIKGGEKEETEDPSRSVIDNTFEDTKAVVSTSTHKNNRVKPFVAPGAAGGTEAYEPSMFGTSQLPNSVNGVSKSTASDEIENETESNTGEISDTSVSPRFAINLDTDKARSRLQSRLDRLHREASTDARSRLLTRLSQLNHEAQLVSRSRGIDHEQVFLEQEEVFQEESQSWPLEPGQYVLSEGEEDWIQEEARIAEKSQLQNAVKNDFGGQSLPRHSLFEDEESPYVDSTSLGQRLGNHIII